MSKKQNTKNKSNDSKVVQNVNIKIGETTTKKLNKKRRAPNKTKKQEKPPLSNYQYPAIIYRDVPQKPTQQIIKQDLSLAKQIQQKFDEEYAKRENEKATRKNVSYNTSGAYNSIDNGFGLSQEVNKINKQFFNDSSIPNNTVIKADNLFQRSNLLNEIKATPVKVNPENIAIADEQIKPANASIYCEVCGGSYRLNNQNRHFLTQKHIKALKKENDLTQQTEQPETQQVSPLPISTSKRKPIDTNVVQELENNFNDIKNKSNREIYLQFATDLIDRKILDNKIDKQTTLSEALHNPNGKEAMSLKQNAFNELRNNNNRYLDELELQFQRAINGGTD